jgi:hypothetical protein
MKMMVNRARKVDEQPSNEISDLVGLREAMGYDRPWPLLSRSH